MRRIYKIKYLCFFILIISCNSQKDLAGNFENKFSVPFYEKPFFTINGINTLIFQYNFELHQDSTYNVYNCLCKSEGKFEVRNDSLILLNKSQRTDSIPICFEKYEYRIKNGGNKIIRRDEKQIERLYKIKQ